MDDKFDKDLTNRISKVFEDYSYPPADEGWVELRKKFPVKNNNKADWLWWASAAAILLVFLGVGLWLVNQQKPVEQVAQHPVSHQQADTVKVQTQNTQGTEHPALPQNDITNTHLKSNASVLLPQISSPGYAGRYNIAPSPIKKVIEDGIAAANQNALAARTDVNKAKTITPTVTAPDSAQDNSMQASGLPIAKNEQTSIIDTNPIIAQKSVPQKSIMELLKSERTVTVAKKDNKLSQNTRRVNFSVYAATYINYATGSANQINAGAGFTSDIRLNKNFKLSTGVALAQNTLRYDNAPPSNSGAVAFAASPSIRQSNLFSTASSVPEFKNYNARLVGLDIPLNIKYEFNPQKSDTYVSAGLSSGTFIDERYSYSYLYRNNSLFGATSTTTVQTEDQTSSKNFNSFYFGKTLNVSFGVGYPLGKNNRLIIEPFLKYPLEGLGAQQIRFGAGGLNLKINFKTTKR